MDAEPRAAGAPAAAAGAGQAVVNAIVDGLWREYKIDHIDMPATPERVWIAISEHRRRPYRVRSADIDSQ